MEYYSVIKKIEKRKMDGTGYYHVNLNKPDSERQVLHVFSS